MATEQIVITPDLSQISLVGFRFAKCEIREEAGAMPRLKEAGTLSAHEVTTKTSFNTEQSRFNVEFEMVLSVKDSADALLAEARMHLVFSYLVADMERLLEPIGRPPHVRPNVRLALTLVGTSYSTARGLILAKVANTALEGFSLPLVDARSLLMGDAKASSSSVPKRRRKTVPGKARKAAEK